MQAYDFVHLSLYALGGVRKDVLQARTYFVGHLMSQDLYFQPTFYEPYSSAVACAVDRLIDLRFAKCTGDALRLTPAGKVMACAKVCGSSEFLNKLLNVKDAVKNAGRMDVESLKVAAKIHQRIGDVKVAMDGLYEITHAFGWRVPEAQTRKAAKFLNNLELMTVTK